MQQNNIYNGILRIWTLIDTNPVTVCDHMPYKPNCITCSKDLLTGLYNDSVCCICSSNYMLMIEWFSKDDYRPICVNCCYKIRTKQPF